MIDRVELASEQPTSPKRPTSSARDRPAFADYELVI